MVLDKIKNLISSRRDIFDPRGLEQFTPKQQERILSKIGAKEAELLERKADAITARRIAQLEKKAGLREPRRPGEKSSLQKFKEFRQGNLRRQAERNRRFKENERLFREGKLGVKPVGPTPVEQKKKMDEKLKVKEIKLKAPSSGMN